MKFKSFSHYNAENFLLNNNQYKKTYLDLLNIIDSIKDEDIINKFEEIGANSKSISKTLSLLLDEGFKRNNWEKEEEIFYNSNMFLASSKGKRWTLDYFKNEVAVEVAFNHEETSAWNIFKIVLSSNKNKYKLKNSIKVGVILCVTNQMKVSGGFDNSVGTFEKYQQYLDFFEAMIETPILLIGLHSPDDFKISHRKIKNKLIGKVRGKLL